MAKQLNVNMSFQADTSQAKKVLSDLNKMLDNILSHRSITIEDQSIQQAKQAALDLKHHLDAAVNVNTGKLDLSKFSASLNKSGQSLQGLYTNLSKIGPEGQSAFLSLSQSIAKADASAITLGSKLGNLMTVLKNTARWQISSSILHGFMGSIQGAYRYAQDLNESLNNIRIVTGQNEEQMARFAKTANDAAKALSTTTTQYTNASLIYYQQGLSDEEVKARTDATIKLANVSRQSAEEVSDQMTAVWNNFAEGSDNLEYYIDVMAKLGATTASSTQEISTGLEKFAAVANTVGLSYEYATAALATVTAKTRQSADVVGTAFKTLFARLQDLELGDTLEDGTTLGKYSAALNAVGVNIKDINGEVKDMDQILDELGSKWNNIAKDQQIALAQTVAGTRQYTQLVALMDNWDFMQENLNTVAGASGELDRQAKIYAESWEAARDRVTAAAEEIYSQLLNDNAFIDILNGFEKFLNLISNIIDGLGGLKGVLLLIGSIFMQQYAKEMPVFLSKMISQIQILTGAAEKQRQAMLNNNNEILMSMNGGDSKGLSAQIIGMQKISEMYSELAIKRKTLSSAEIAAYEQKIKDVEMYGQIAQAIGQEVDKLNEEAVALNRSASQDLSNSGHLNKINYDELDINQINQIENLIPELDTAKQKIQEIEKALAEMDDEADPGWIYAYEDELNKLKIKAKELKANMSGKDLLKGFQEASKQVGKIQSVLTTTSEKTKQWDQEIKNIGTDSKLVEKLKQEMIAYRDKLEEAKIDTKEIDKALEDIKEDGTGLKEVSELFADIGNADPGLNIANAEQKVEQYKNALIQLGVNSTVLDDLEAKWKAGAISTKTYEVALQQLEAQQKGTLTHGVKMSEVFTQVGSTMMQVSMAINAIKNIGNIWSDKDMSTGEKILQTMTAMGTLLPTLVGLYKTLTTIRAKLVTTTAADATASAADAGAKTAEAGATSGAAVAQEALNVAMESNPIGGIIIAITALVAVLAILVTALMAVANAETEEEKAVRLANERFEESKKAAEEARAAYEELKNAISSYDSVLEVLDKCVKGTQEWRDAFQEVLDKTYELIEKYPQLLQYEDLFNNDGTLNREVLQRALDAAEQAKILTQNSLLRASAQKTTAEFNLKRTETEKDASQKINQSRYSYSYDATTQSQKQVDNWAGLKKTSEIVNDIAVKLQTSGQIINEENIKKEALAYLEENNVSADKINIIVDTITAAMMPLADEFKNLGNEAQASANALNNAQKLIAQNLFGEQLEKNSDKEFAYIQAYNEQVEKELDNINDTIGDQFKWHRGGSSDNVENGKIGDSKELYDFFEDWKKATGHEEYSLVSDDAIEYYEGSRAYQYHTGNGDDTAHAKFINMREDVAAYRAAQNLEAVMARADEIFNGMSSRLNNMTGAGSAAMTAFLNNGDIGTSSVRSAEALAEKAQQYQGTNEEFIQEMLTGQTGEKGKEALIQYLAKKYNISEELVKSGGYYDNFIRESTEALSFSFDDAIKGATQRVKNSISQLKDGLDVSSIDKVTNMYTKALAESGEAGIKVLDDIAAAAGEEAGNVMEVLADLDLSTTDVDQINTLLESLGINFKITEDQLTNFKNVLVETGKITAEEAQKTYKEISSILSKLKKEGDTIEQEAYDKLLKLNPALASYFTMMADGTYMLVGAAGDFQKAVQTSQIQQLREAQMNKAQSAMNYDIAVGSEATDLWLKVSKAIDQGYSDRISHQGGSGVYDFENDFSKNYGNINSAFDRGEYAYKTRAITKDEYAQYQQEYLTRAKAQIDILERNNKVSQDIITTWKAQIEAGENLEEVTSTVQQAFDEMNLSEEEMAKQAAEASAEVEKLNEAIKEAQYQNDLANANLDYIETENYADVLMEVYEAEGLTKDQARQLAIANQRLDRGLSSLNDNFEDWSKKLNKNEKNTAEYAKTIGEVKEAFIDILNISDANELSASWVDSWMKDSEKMKKILDGDQKAIDELRESAFTEMTTNVFTDMKDSVQEMIDSLNEAGEEVPKRLLAINSALASGKFEAENLRAAIQDLSENEIGSGAVLSQEYVDSLNQMLAAGVLTEQQLNDIFSQIGYKPKVTTATVDQETYIPEYITEEVLQPGQTLTFNDGTGDKTYTGIKKISRTYQSGGKTMMQKVPVAQIESADKAGGNIDIVNAGAQRITPSHGATSSGKAGKGGGGGGGKSPTKKAIEKKDDESERYHVVRAQIEDLSKEYDKASKAKDRLFGAARLQMLNKEIAATDKLTKKQKQYLDEIEQYRKSDFSALTSTGKKNGIQYTVEDANGNQKLKTANVLGLKDWLGMDVIADPNGVITNYDQIMEAAKNWYNKKIDEYNAMSASQQEAADKNGWKDLVEGQYSGFMDLLKQYEETNDLWEEEFEKLLDKYREKQDLELEKFQYKIEINVKLNDAEIKRLEYIRKSLADDRWKSVEYLMTLWNNEGKNSTYQQLLEQGGIHAAAAEELLGASHGDVQLDANGNVISQPQYSDAGWLEALDQEEEAIYNNIDALYDLDDQMVHYYEETLSNANEKLNQYMTKLEDCTALLEHYKTLMGLIDKQDSEYYARMDKLLKAQQQTAANEYARAEQEYELAEKRYREMFAEYENTDWTGNEAGKQKMEEQLQAAYEHMTEWQDKALSKAEALAEAIKAVYENAVEGASHEMEMALTGGMGFDELSNSMDRASSTADLLLTKTNQIYETNKLMRQLSQDIDKIDSAAAKTKLKNFRDEIQDMQNMNEMTKFDLEVAKARYEVLKAQIALEEAQNAKSTVRLQRDNEGNYGYVYTADQDKINDTRQQLEDKQNDLYNLTLEKANESAQALIQLDQDYVAELNRINTEYANDEARRQELLAQLEEEYLRKREILEKDAATANYWLNETAATDTSEAWGNAYKDIIADTDTWKTESEKYIGAVNAAHKQYQQDIDNTVKPAVDRLDEAIGKATQDSEKYSQWFEDFANNNDSNLKAISDITNEYFKQRQEIIALIQQLNNYIAQIDAARRALAQLQAQEQQPKDRSSSSQSGTGATLPTFSGNGGSGSGNSGPGNSGGTSSSSPKPTPSSGNVIWKVRLNKRSGGYNIASSGDESSARACFNVEKGKASNANKYSSVELLRNNTIVDSYTFKTSSGGGCFTGDSQIIMGDYTFKKLKDVKINDYVLAYNEEKKYFEIEQVLDIYIQHKAYSVVDVYLSNGEILKMTPSHPLLTSQGWKSLDIEKALFEHGLETTLLKVNDIILGFGTYGKVEKIIYEDMSKDIEVYTLMVNNCHTFIVNNMIVHNMPMVNASAKYASGGYTGEWIGGSQLDNGKLAILHQKELVLNEDDTKNMLKTVSLVREISQILDLQAGVASLSTGISPASIWDNTQTLEQMVTIHAEFPNAVNHTEIEEAFDTLVNRASQYAGRSRK